MDLYSTTSNVNSVERKTAYSGNQVNNGGDQFTSDTFYKLLAAQMQYQDPTQPMDNTQMILQMAQFSTIEQLNNLNNQFSYFMEMSTIQSGATMVGKEVTIGLENDESITGVVTKVGFTSSGPIVEVDGKYYEMWRVVEISNGTTTETPPTTEGETGDTEQTPTDEV